jgi:NitT/TauT family transport system permease protein
MNKLFLKAPATITFIAILIAWEIICRVMKVEPYIFPTPSATLKALIEFAPQIAHHAWQTFWTTMIGFVIAVAVGVFLGALLGSSQTVYRALYPLLVGFNSVPKAAFVPVLVVWFGIGTVPAIITAFLIAFFPIAVNVATGLATLEPELEDVLRALGATRLDVLMKVGFPRSLPFFFASLKVSITLAFVGTVVSELTAANEGIGQLMLSAGGQSKMDLVFAGLVVISAMAMVMYQLFTYIETHTTQWAHRGSQSH